MVVVKDSKYSLPKIFREVQKPLQTEEEKKIAFLSVLTIYPAFFPKAYYRSVDKIEKLNLYTAIFIPAASGKRLIQSVGKLAEATERQVQTRKRGFNAREFSTETGTHSKKGFLLPSNITASRLVEKIERNAGYPLLMIETEMDSLTNSTKGEHGRDISVVLRKAYENETIALSRRKNDEDIYIEEPWLSLLAGGTIDSFHSFFKGNRDGMMSRFLFYAPENVSRKSSGLAKDGKPLEVYYREMGEDLVDLYDQYFDASIEVVFKESQYLLKDDHEIRWEQEFSAKGHENFVSMIRRMGARVMKIAAIFTLARFVESAPDFRHEVKLECSDDDLNFSFEIADEYLMESYNVFVESDGITSKNARNTRSEDFFENLSTEFVTNEAVALGNENKICKRSVMDYLSGFVDSGRLVKVEHGRYKKRDTQDLSTTAMG